MAEVLTHEQRWLLAGVGGWPIAECLTDPTHGISRLMTSMHGSSNGRRTEQFPEWLAGGVACGNGRIVSPWTWRPGADEAPHAAVTSAQLARFAATVPDALRERLREQLRENHRETVRWSTTCFCGDPSWHETDPIYRDRWHPTEAQRLEHNARYHANREALDALVLEACDVETPQLALF